MLPNLSFCLNLVLVSTRSSLLILLSPQVFHKRFSAHLTMHTMRSPKHRSRTSIHHRPHSPEQAPSLLQHLPASILLLIATALAPPVLKHTFRPPGYRTAQRSLLSSALTCRALRTSCFPLAVQVFRSPSLKPQNVADLGESAIALEAKVDFLLARESLWGLIR